MAIQQSPAVIGEGGLTASFRRPRQSFHNWAAGHFYHSKNAQPMTRATGDNKDNSNAQRNEERSLKSEAARLEARSPLLAGPILGMLVGADSDRIRAAKDYVHFLRQTKSDQSRCSLPEQLNCLRTHLVHGGKLLIQRTAPWRIVQQQRGVGD